jgi:hypothetical protein
MFKLVISDTIVVPVEGEIYADGKKVPISFDLLCKRSTADEIKEAFKPADSDDEDAKPGDVDLKAIMRDLITDWRHVMDGDGKPLDFSEEAREALLNFPGVAALAVNSYLLHFGAKGKEKNSKR